MNFTHSAVTILAYLFLLYPAKNDNRNATSTADVVITYTGNMGTLITSKSNQILIDGMHLKYYDDYVNPPQQTLDSMIAGKGAYNIQLLLFTHRHRDHFNPVPVKQYLSLGKKNLVMASKQVCDSLAEDKNTTPYSSQQILVAENQSNYVLSKNCSIEPLFIPHTWAERHSATINYTYIITINGKKIIHFGDAHIDEATFQKAGLDKLTFDAAIVPVWFLGNASASVTKKYIHTKQLIVTHISPLEKEFTAKARANASKYNLNAIFFSELFQQAIIK